MSLPTKLYVVHSDTVESFFSSVSNGLYDIKGSNVTEWLKLPWSRHDVYRMALTDRRLQSNKKEKPFAVRDINFLRARYSVLFSYSTRPSSYAYRSLN